MSSMPSTHSSPPETSPGRRGFLKGFTAAVLGLSALLAAPLAGLRVWLQPLRKQKSSQGLWVKVALLSAIPDDGSPRRFPIIADQVNAWTKQPNQSIGAVYLRKNPDSRQVEALNVVCPHAGCLVDYQQGDTTFHCPCHDSRFALDGAIASAGSPSPRGLDQLVAEVRSGTEVWVQFQNFRPGIEEKEPVT
jgi:menaquinol-cytochrome c reductase iron-sulfur subunit